ncbi:MAG: hypothetical protein WCH01_17660, partial [Methylococcaceae bacterium]
KLAFSNIYASEKLGNFSFKVLTPIKRIDLLEQWIIHLFNDESENHVMRETVAIQQLQEAGFSAITVSHRNAINALVTAKKPIK